MATPINTTQGTLVSKPIGLSQDGPDSMRSMYHDIVNGLYRDFRDKQEVMDYLPLLKNRSGHIFVYIHIGGTLNSDGTYTGGTTELYWFKDGRTIDDIVPIFEGVNVDTPDWVTVTVDTIIDIATPRYKVVRPASGTLVLTAPTVAAAAGIDIFINVVGTGTGIVTFSRAVNGVAGPVELPNGLLIFSADNAEYNATSLTPPTGGGLDATGVRAVPLTGFSAGAAIDNSFDPSDTGNRVSAADTILQAFQKAWRFILYLLRLLGFLPRVFNVKKYGAKGDGVTDDSAAIIAAMDACDASGGGIVYIPSGIYIINNPVITSLRGANPNCQLPVPWRAYGDIGRCAIKIVGEASNGVPTSYASAISVPIPTSGTIIRSTITGPGGEAAVFGTPIPPTSGVFPFNLNDISFENILIERYTNNGTQVPSLIGVNMRHVAHVCTDNLSVGLDVTALNSADARGTNTIGMVVSKLYNDGPNFIKGGLFWGDAAGILASEHTTFEHPYIFACEYAVAIPQSGFAITGKFLSHGCVHDLLIKNSGFDAGVVEAIDLIIESETQGSGTVYWFSNTGNVVDIAGNGRGTVRINRITGGVGTPAALSNIGTFNNFAVIPLAPEISTISGNLTDGTALNALLDALEARGIVVNGAGGGGSTLLAGATRLTTSASGWTQSGNVWTHATSGQFALAQQILPGATDGFVAMQYQPGAAGSDLLLTDGSTTQVGLHFHDSGDIRYYNGSAFVTTGDTATAGSWYKLNRAGTTWTIEESADGVNWTTIYTYTGSFATGDYPIYFEEGFNVAGTASSLYYPQGIGIV